MSLQREKAIKEILKDFENKSNLLLEQLDSLEKFINTGDIKIKDEVFQTIKEIESKIDIFEVEISEKIIQTVVLYQPKASDLRKIMAIYRISINIERIGDLVINIINFIIGIKNPDVYKQMSGLISNMLSLSSIMVKKSLISFLNADKDYALWTIKNDELVDELNHKLLKTEIRKGKFSEETKKIMESYISLKSIVLNIERIADHATNIAEASIYSMDGTDVRHLDMDNI